MAASLIGRSLGKYQIVDLIGQGGMATVYKGYQEDVQRYVAVKVLPPHPGQSDEYIARFRLEARTIARLQHPHILPLYDYGLEDDILYLVTPFIEGGSLRERIEGGPLPTAEVNRILQQLAPALDYAHKNGVVHRDIKPANILISGEGNATLADFGVVKMVAEGTMLTATSGVIGTPAYMAPEQGQGLTVDGRSDIYSLGVVTYEMLSGLLPFTADTPWQLLFKHITEPVPNILDLVQGLPIGIEAVLLRAVAKDPQDRYQTAGAFAGEFAQVVQGTLSAGTAITPTVTARGTGAAPTESSTIDREATIAAPSTQPGGAPHPPAEPARPTRTSDRRIWLAGGAIIVVLLVVAIALLIALASRAPEVAVAEATSTPQAMSMDHDDPPAGGYGYSSSRPTATRAPVVIAPSTGNAATFSTAARPGDTIAITLPEIAPPPAGRQYAGWLLAGDTAQFLGWLTVDAEGEATLRWTDPNGRMLPASFTEVLVSAESAITAGPGDQVLYRGSVLAMVVPPLRDLFIVSADGRPDRSLIDDILAEADLGVRHAELAASASSLGSLRTHAEHTLNIIQGTQEDLNGDGSAQNPGLGFGLPYFLERIDERLAAVSEDAAPALHDRTEDLRICLMNTQERLSQAVALGTEALDTTDFDAARRIMQQDAQLLAELINGGDLNENRRIEMFEGECGLRQVADFGPNLGEVALEEVVAP